MKVYKFRDKVDSRYCFIIANSKNEAYDVLKNLTSIPFVFVEYKTLEELKRPVVLYNNILPF